MDNEVELRNLTENYIEGLQWVLYYYYRGVASWPWFYKYHYSPRISDIHRGLGANLNFKLGQPFKPYEQLMGVLPDRSKKIVPEAYHELMTSPNSPIIDFYPRDFELDMNGKKMEWEAVVKIPFIQEDRLLAAMKTREHLLKPDERERNGFGVSLKFTYAPDQDIIYPSPNGIFPDIAHCKCVMNIYELPTLDGLDIIVGLCEGVKVGKHALAGFPSLMTLPHTAQLGFHGVNVFQQDSRQESMVVTLENAYQGGKVEEAKALIGKRVFVGYPFLQEAKVTAISDELFRYAPGNPGQPVIPVPHGPQEINMFKRKAERIENHYSKRMGIVIGPVEILVHVDMLKGMRRTDEGAMVKEYAQIPSVDADYAAQTLVLNVLSEDQRFIEKEAAPIEEEFPIGSKAFFLGEYNYGRPLEVLNHRPNNRADIWVATSKGKEPDFAKQIVQNAERNTPYVASYMVARKLGLNPLVLSKITSSFSVIVDEQRINLGLNLKFEAKKLKVLGYSRRSDSGWEFSYKAIDLIKEYMQKFPDFFAGIMRNPQGDLYSDTDFWDASVSKDKIKEIKDFLKTIETRNMEKVPLDAAQLEKSVVQAIEKATDEYNAANKGDVAKRVNNVPRKALLKPEDAEHRLSDQRFSIGDRVIYVAGTGKVPIASRGTVIGITRSARHTLLDVVFDITWLSATTLGGRCSAFRGMTVPAASVLNLTQRQLIAGSKAAPAPAATETVQQPNYRNAPPPPALTAPYSSAHRGGRGRGGQRGNFQPRGAPTILARGGRAPQAPRPEQLAQQQPAQQQSAQQQPKSQLESAPAVQAPVAQDPAAAPVAQQENEKPENITDSLISMLRRAQISEPAQPVVPVPTQQVHHNHIPTGPIHAPHRGAFQPAHGHYPHYPLQNMVYQNFQQPPPPHMMPGPHPFRGRGGFRGSAPFRGRGGRGGPRGGGHFNGPPQQQHVNGVSQQPPRNVNGAPAQQQPQQQ